MGGPTSDQGPGYAPVCVCTLSFFLKLFKLFIYDGEKKQDFQSSITANELERKVVCSTWRHFVPKGHVTGLSVNSLY